jgi:hypothetical protein
MTSLSSSHGDKISYFPLLLLSFLDLWGLCRNVRMGRSTSKYYDLIRPSAT